MGNQSVGQLSHSTVDQIMNKYRGKIGEVLSILEEVQESHSHKYIPEETLLYLSEKSGIPLTQLYSVVTFYSFFNLKPQGEHTIIVCRGTACHTKGSKALLEEIGLWMGVGKDNEDGEMSYTTPDNQFTVRTVACFGQCALSPVISVDGVIYGNVTLPKIKKVIDKIAKGGR